METPTWVYIFSRWSFGSYPTYEEWKPITGMNVNSSSFGSYPTYEEWKLMHVPLSLPLRTGSYPTYEEWKHSSILSTRLLLLSFLSYL